MQQNPIEVSSLVPTKESLTTLTNDGSVRQMTVGKLESSTLQRVPVFTKKKSDNKSNTTTFISVKVNNWGLPNNEIELQTTNEHITRMNTDQDDDDSCRSLCDV